MRRREFAAGFCGLARQTPRDLLGSIGLIAVHS